MIEKELRKQIGLREEPMSLAKKFILEAFCNICVKDFALEERERAIVACQIVKELQNLVNNYYTRQEIIKDNVLNLNVECERK